MKIGQQNVLEFLNRNKNEWVANKQISKALGINVINTMNSTKKLKKYKWIDFIESEVGFKFKHINQR